MSDSTERKWVSAKDLAAKYGVSARHITGLAESGVIPGVQVGKTWRFQPEEVHAALEARTAARFRRCPRSRRDEADGNDPGSP